MLAPEGAAVGALRVDHHTQHHHTAEERPHQKPQQPRLQEEALADQAPDQAITILTMVHLLREDMVTPTIVVESLSMSIMELELTTTISSMA